MPAEGDGKHGIVLFDGVCNLCNASVQFILDRDPGAYFRFASLQSEVGQALCAQFGVTVPDGAPETILLVEGGRCHTQSGAALRISRRLSGLWPALWALLLVPAPLRDAAYRLVARNRYRWFGHTESCRLPSPQLRERFLEA